MKEVCKNYVHAKPTYKGVTCELKGNKKTKTTGTCEDWRGKG